MGKFERKKRVLMYIYLERMSKESELRNKDYLRKLYSRKDLQNYEQRRKKRGQKLIRVYPVLYLNLKKVAFNNFFIVFGAKD